jgi:hypothetical protein
VNPSPSPRNDSSQSDRSVQRQVVEPVRPHPTRAAKAPFEAAGWGDDAPWLAKATSACLVPVDDEPESIETSDHLRWIADAASVSHDRDERLRELLARVASIGAPHFAASVRLRRRTGSKRGPLAELLDEFRSRDVAIGPLVLGAWPQAVAQAGSPEAQLRAFAACGEDPDTGGALAPPAVAWLRSVGEADAAFVRSLTLEATAPVGAPAGLATWLVALGPRALEGASEQAAACAEIDTWERSVLAIREAVDAWLLARHEHFESFDRIGSAARGPLGALLARGAELLHAAGDRPSIASRGALIWLARATVGCTAGSRHDAWRGLPDAVRRAAAHAARECLALERPNLRAAMDASAAERFHRNRRTLSDAVCLLSEYEGIWAGMKPMLLAWRALGTTAVARDLRYWDEPGREQVPQPWSQLVMWPIALLHSHARAEEESDPGLQRLRSELADFCLDRLVDTLGKSDREAACGPRAPEQMKEPSAEWRYTCIRAFGALGVDPKGSAGRRLRMSSVIDPDESVRNAAAEALRILPWNQELADDASPRRAVLSALWWLRQGHLLALGLEPDADGAQRTRVKELARTRERRSTADDGGQGGR